MPVVTGVGRRVAALRITLCALAAAGAILLLVSVPATVLEIEVAGTRAVAAGADLSHSGWERHGPALLLLAVVALVLCAGALRGARPAAVALAACGLAALLIVLLGDLPDLDKTGLVGEVYADAQAGPAAGWYLETAGSVLLLVSGVSLVALSTSRGRRAERTRIGSSETRTAAERPAPERPAADGAAADRAATDRAAADRAARARARAQRRTRARRT
jgi:hypothetical protein